MLAVDAKKQSGAKKLAFYHFDPGYNDEKLDEIAQHYQNISDNIILAQEGLEISL